MYKPNLAAKLDFKYSQYALHVAGGAVEQPDVNDRAQATRNGLRERSNEIPRPGNAKGNFNRPCFVRDYQTLYSLALLLEQEYI